MRKLMSKYWYHDEEEEKYIEKSFLCFRQSRKILIHHLSVFNNKEYVLWLDNRLSKKTNKIILRVGEITSECTKGRYRVVLVTDEYQKDRLLSLLRDKKMS